MTKGSGPNNASADVVLINIGVAPDLVARSQGRSKYSQSNASKQFQNMETVFRCLDSGVDGTCVVHCFPHPGRSRVDGGLMKLLGLLQPQDGVLSSGAVASHHRLLPMRRLGGGWQPTDAVPCGSSHSDPPPPPEFGCRTRLARLAALLPRQ